MCINEHLVVHLASSTTCNHQHQARARRKRRSEKCTSHITSTKARTHTPCPYPGNVCVCVRVCVRVCIVSHLRVHQGTGNDMEPRPHCLHVRHGSVPPGTVALQQFRVVFVGQQLLGCGRQRERKDGSVSGCWRLSARVRARQTRDIWFCSWCLSVSEQPCRHR